MFLMFFISYATTSDIASIVSYIFFRRFMSADIFTNYYRIITALLNNEYVLHSFHYESNQQKLIEQCSYCM